MPSYVIGPAELLDKAKQNSAVDRTQDDVSLGMAGIDALDQVTRGVREGNKRAECLWLSRLGWRRFQGSPKRFRQHAIILPLFLVDDLLGDSPKLFASSEARQQFLH
jgi:uncharacterized protein YoaH (UPF0181 family)